MTTNPNPDQARKWPVGAVDKMNEWAESQLGFSLEPWQMDWLRQMEAPQPRTLPEEQATEENPDPPRPEDVPEPHPGEAWLIEHEGGHCDAIYWYSPIYAHWSFVVSREGLKSIESGEAKALRRLVPDKEERA